MVLTYTTFVKILLAMQLPTSTQTNTDLENLSYDNFKSQVLKDYEIAMISRETSLLGRKEVLTGKAKFGIFGDGKEIAQIAWAKFFQNGDFRSGYYRDQTFMLAANLMSVQEFFAQLYADTNTENEPMSSGRQMNGHFATTFVDAAGNWLPLTQHKNVSADIAPTAAQMPRALGLAYASKSFRNTKGLEAYTDLSTHGNEICFCTIGDASTSEGHFWETINAAGVLQIPLAVLVWDNGFGISVPKKYQTTKSSISKALSGFQQTDNSNGIDIYKVKGWDYAGMCETMEAAFTKCRTTHIPCLIHVEEITQPQGHSTSGSHERYKSAERLEWEKEWDCIKKMREWILENAIASEEEITTLESQAKEMVKTSKQEAWNNYTNPIKNEVATTITILQDLAANNPKHTENINTIITSLQNNREPLRRDIVKPLRNLVYQKDLQQVYNLKTHITALLAQNKNNYNTHLYNETNKSALQVPEVKAILDDTLVNGYEVLNHYFDQLFTTNNKVFAFGEDVGQIGDVNQGFAGLQEKHGTERIFDTGIRETTIIGQGIGMAMRGLRPIAEIQYLDYLLYALQTLSDDVCTLHYRTRGKQSCPIIVRTRGHRLEGIWHSGSPMGVIVNALRGMYVCVPRNMTQAVGMYNTLLQSNDPGIVIECLNGYRLKEALPTNLLQFTVPFGIPEILEQGEDVTVVSYGSTLRIIEEASKTLRTLGITIELIDVQTLLPFDTHQLILASLKKTNRILIVDEDVPGGAAAYMYTEIIEKQNGYKYLDVAARTLTAKAHRPPYGSDGDYFTKPNAEDVVEAILEMMAE
jgi:pyruvate/2-oxoglutarate/acetoin dehydrogenase E1 component/TPP-dependent pyruvate/acetoin dehydrogenase alpha subunit